jgi:Transposase-associated domain
MELSCDGNEYRAGFEAFLDFAFERTSVNGDIKYPCKRCVNSKWHKHEICKFHLIRTIFISHYTNWICHGVRKSQPNPNTDLNINNSLGGLLRDVMFGNHEFVQNEFGGGGWGLEEDTAEVIEPMGGLENEPTELVEPLC